MRERLLKHFGGDVLGGCPIGRPAADEGVHAVDVPVVELNEPGGIGLRRLDQGPVVVYGRRHISPVPVL
jgi:hypothetical protein